MPFQCEEQDILSFFSSPNPFSVLSIDEPAPETYFSSKNDECDDVDDTHSTTNEMSQVDMNAGKSKNTRIIYDRDDNNNTGGSNVFEPKND